MLLGITQCVHHLALVVGGVCHIIDINHSAEISCFSCKSKTSKIYFLPLTGRGWSSFRCKSKTSKICFLPLQVEEEVGQGLGGVFAGAGRGARQPDLLRAPDRARQLRHPRAHLHPPQLPGRTGIDGICIHIKCFGELVLDLYRVSQSSRPNFLRE